MYRIRVLSFIVLVNLLGVATIMASPVSEGATPDDCLTSAHTIDLHGHHYSYIKSDSVLIGYDLFVETTCGDFELQANNITLAGGSTSVFANLPDGTTSIQVVFDNYSIEYTNLSIFPAGEMYYGQYNNPNEITVTSSSIWWNEIISHIVTFLIVFILSTTVVHRIAQYKVEREFEVFI